MRYIVTGATSFLGLELIDYLLREGHEVVAVCRPQSSALTNIPLGVEVVLADMSEYGGLYRDVPEADVWVNLAWEGTGHDGRNQEELQQANVVNTIAAMFGADKMGCRLFVEAGSQAEYGTVLTPISEATPCNPFSAYGKAKLEVCRRLSELSAELGIKYLHLRIFSLYGETDHPWTLVMSSLDKMLRNEAIDLSPCTQQWNFLYVKDATRQVVTLCDYALSRQDFRSEVFNIASDDSRPLKEFVERMKELAGSKSPLNYGAITPQNVVSLLPDMTKTRNVVGTLSEYSFDNVITSILSNLNK
jgi:nucleoside-diphosphate-sugar epimerase